MSVNKFQISLELVKQNDLYHYLYLYIKNNVHVRKRKTFIF